MSSVGYCFNICRTIDKNITNQRKNSLCNTIPNNTPPNTGTLIFGRRFSLSNIILPSVVNPTPQKQDNSSTDQH